MAGLLDIMNQVGQGLAYNTPEAKKQRSDDQELEMWTKKQELANKMSIDLERRKMELSQEFPEMKQVINAPWGVTFARTKDGVQEIARDEDVRNAYIGKMNSAATNANARAAEVPSRIDLNSARAGLAGAQAGVVQQGADARTTTAQAAQTRAATVTQPKPPTANQAITAQLNAIKLAKARMPGRTDRQKEKAWSALSPAEQEAMIVELTQGASPAGVPSVATPASSYGVFGKHVPQQ
jgi:hypothetical protein